MNNKSTLYSHDAAHHHNMATLPPLHVRQQLLHQPSQAKEVCVEELLHVRDTLALKRSNHANTSIVHCNNRTFCHCNHVEKYDLKTKILFMTEKRRRQTKNIHPSARQAVYTLSDGGFTTGIQLFDFQSFVQGVTCCFFQGPTFLKVPHCGDHCLR